MIGGSQIYGLALPLATRCEVTEVDIDLRREDDDALAPVLDESWMGTEGHWQDSSSGLRYRFYSYLRQLRLVEPPGNASRDRRRWIRQDDRSYWSRSNRSKGDPMKLLDEVLAAHGGVTRWQQVDTITIHQIVGGVLWPLKHVDGILDDSTVEIRVQEQQTWHRPLPKPGLRSSFTPGRVVIEHDDDDTSKPLEILHDPRASFAGHTLDDPVVAAATGVLRGLCDVDLPVGTVFADFSRRADRGTRRLAENGQTWRRLAVRYPDSIATHSVDQVLYVDSDGLLRRRDYQVDIAGGSPAAHYMDDHREFGGIVMPVRRIVHPRDEAGRPVPDTVTVSIDIDDVTVR